MPGCNVPSFMALKSSVSREAEIKVGLSVSARYAFQVSGLNFDLSLGK